MDGDNITDNITLHDVDSNPIGVVLKNGIYRLEGRSILTSPDGTRDVSVITDGSIERLAVNANITGGVTIKAFTTKFDSEVDTPVVLNTSTDTLLFEVTDTKGKLDFIAINSATSSNFEIILVIDGVEEARIPMSGLNTLGLTTPNNVPMWADTANKNFRYHPSEGDDFLTGFAIKARATTGTPSVFWGVKHREEQ